MTKEYEPLNFFRFDGEGGEGTGAEASESGSEQDVRKIEYGKSKGDGQDNSQVGTDKDSIDLDAEWKALTGKGGAFHDHYGQAVSQAINERFKNQANLQGQVDKITEGLSPLFMNYGLKAGDFDGLTNAIAHDESFYKAGAEKAGLDVEQYKENLRLRADAERGRAITEAYEQQQRQHEMFTRWEAEANTLRTAFPNFDLGMELQHNEEFANLVYSGADVKSAFLTTHINEILAGSNAEAHKAATSDVINRIQQRSARPAEGAMHQSAAIQRKADPSRLTGEDIDEINRRVANGETISF